MKWLSIALAFVSHLGLPHGCSAQVLPCGESLIESIDFIGDQDAFTLQGVITGDTITLRMRATSGGLDPFLELRDAGNALIASGAGVTLTLTLPANGPFRVTASDQGNNETGDYELFFQRLNGGCNATALACGARVLGSLLTGARIDTYALSGVGSGNVVTVRMRGSGFDPDSYLELYDGSGTLIGQGAGATLTLTLTTSGPYTLLARDDFYNGAGEYEVFLQRVNGPCAATTLSCGQSLAGNLSTGQEIDTYSLAGVSAGNVVTVRMRGPGFDPDSYLELYDGAGTLIGQGAGATLTLTLTTSGPYTLLARDDFYNGAGDYEVFLQRVNGPCAATTLSCGQSLAGNLSTGQEIDTYSLAGVSAGNVVTVRMRGPGFDPDSYLELYDGSGTLIGQGAGATLTLTLTTPGPYTLLARDDFYNGAGDYEVFLQRVNGPCAATTLSCGQSLAGNLSTGQEIDTYSLAGVSAGNVVTVRMRGSGFDPDSYLELYDGSGTLVGQGAGATLTLALTTPGPYTLLARDDFYNGSGDYILFLQRFNVPCNATPLSVGQTVATTLSAAPEIDTYTLQGLQPGHVVTLCMARTSGTLDPFIELFDGAGNPVGTAADRLTATVPGTAPYVVFARDNGYDETGGYTLGLRGAASSCAAADTAPPAVTTVAPEPAELVPSGSSYLIRWSSSDDVGVSSHTLRLSTDGGATFPTVIAGGLSGAAQSYLWSIPPALHSTEARIRVIARDAVPNLGQGETPGDFLLVDDPPTRTVTYTYDSLNRLVGTAYSDGSSISYTYDAVGNRVAMSSTSGVLFADGFDSGDTSAWSATVP